MHTDVSMSFGNVYANVTARKSTVRNALLLTRPLQPVLIAHNSRIITDFDLIRTSADRNDGS